MLLYDFRCVVCGEELELLVPYAERDQFRIHCVEHGLSICGGALIRCNVQRINVGVSSYEPGALLSDGSTRRGHFGKTARKKGKGRYFP